MKSKLFHKAFLLCMGCFCLLGTSKSQNNLILQFVDKSQANAALNNISKITFSGDNLEMNYTDGTLSSYAIASVAKISFNITSGVDEISSQSDLIALYPNPANEIIYIKNVPESVSYVTIFKLDGSCVKTVSVSEINNGIVISDLPSGFYVIKVGVNALKFNKL